MFIKSILLPFCETNSINENKRMGLPELIRLFYADSFLIFGVSIKFGHNGSRKQTSRTKVYPEAGERRFDFRANPYGRILQPV